MDWIELIHLRAYSHRDCVAAVAAFHGLTSPERENGLEEVTLLRNAGIDTDMGILIHWGAGVPPKGKSRLGLQLSAAFSEYGQINHSFWTCETRLAIKQGAGANKRTEVFHDNRL
ncbi:MAG: hypothetical protein C4530_10395 [Desulfobacteraceae bacterium]|nr:MAG: hypothetical protein C4530_10395 [Desulfobacteraceae bacterium]